LIFFALLNVHGARVRRIDVAQDVQAELTELFNHQYNEFKEGVLETVPLDDYTPEPHELMCIDEFDDVDHIAEAISEPAAVPALEPNSDAIDRIVGLLAGEEVDGTRRALLQVFDRRRSLSRSGYSIIHREQTFKKLVEPGLTFDSTLTATLEDAKLCFRSLHKVRRLFDVDDYYKEATNEELTAFAQHARLETPADLDLVQVADTWIRRKIALIRASGLLDSVPATRIQEIAHSFNLELQLVGVGAAAKLRLPNQKRELKALLKFLNDDYYESPLTEVQYVSSSKRRLSAQAKPAA
jgi:hypothetical protein